MFGSLGGRIGAEWEVGRPLYSSWLSGSGENWSDSRYSLKAEPKGSSDYPVVGFKESGVKFLNYTDRKMVLILMEDKEVDGSKTGFQFGAC